MKIRRRKRCFSLKEVIDENSYSYSEPAAFLDNYFEYSKETYTRGYLSVI
jgi:hypothetical protein|tara:strand:+ start:441 stop:590 length:150 start_codon:yes stop_codon:yes gene_type:complete